MLLATLFAGALGVAFATAGVAPATAHSLKELESQLQERETYIELVERQAPAFTLEDTAGRKVSLEGFKGKAVVLYFIYSRCREACPLQSELIADIQEKVNSTPMRDLVQFVSVATDTEDAASTAEIMNAHGPQHGLDSANWIFLYRGSGQPDAGLKIAEEYGLRFAVVNENGTTDQMHAVVTHVIDQDGVLRARFHGLRFEPISLIIYLNALVNDHKHVPIEKPSFWDRLGAFFSPERSVISSGTDQPAFPK